jgi:hypothetical protein
VLDGPAYRAIGGENLSPWSKRITAKVGRILRFEGEQTMPGEALAPSGAGGLLLVAMTPGAAKEAAFNCWYDKEHVRALAAVPGVLCARRFRSRESAGAKYVALYHLTHRASLIQQNGRMPAARPRCPRTCARRSPTGSVSFACRTSADNAAGGARWRSGDGETVSPCEIASPGRLLTSCESEPIGTPPRINKQSISNWYLA